MNGLRKLVGPNEIKQGYLYNPTTKEYICLVCGEKYVNERDYSIDNIIYPADKAVITHVSQEHANMFEHLENTLHRFELSRKYTEKEVNQILKEANPDYVTLRRYLIDYGFLDRYNDGSSYWVKESQLG